MNSPGYLELLQSLTGFGSAVPKTRFSNKWTHTPLDSISWRVPQSSRAHNSLFGKKVFYSISRAEYQSQQKSMGCACG
jgi:hypothetical protein